MKEVKSSGDLVASLKMFDGMFYNNNNDDDDDN